MVLARKEDPFEEKYCENCGKTGYTEEHHIKTRGAGGKDIALNKIRLCVPCHKNAQEYKINRLHLVQLVAKREGLTPEDVCAAIGIPMPDNFPALVEKKEEPSYEQLVQAGLSLKEQQADCKWIYAQVMDALVKTGAKMSQIASDLGDSVSLVKKYVKTYTAFPSEDTRVPELSFEHHFIASTSKDPAVAIAKAADEQLSTRGLRKIVVEESEDEFKAIADADEQKEIQEAKKIFTKAQEVVSAGGPAGKWLKDKLSELVD